MGGENTGTDPTASYQGGFGGEGLTVVDANATINSGTFAGGRGGAAAGVGEYLNGQFGGDGLLTQNSTTDIYSGTFQGGDSGPAAGIGTLGSLNGGEGLRVLTGSTVNVYSGSFTGGSGASVPGGTNGGAGVGLLDEDGVLNVYGGTFTGGPNGLFGFGLDAGGGTTTLYGSDFFVNGVAMSSGSVTGIGTISGIFQNNGTVSTFTYRVDSGGTLNISAPTVPEASTTVSFGLLLALGLGGLVVAARRKKIAP